MYYFEPYGGWLSGKNPVLDQFKDRLLPQGWKVVNLRLELQTDDVSCGLWAVILTRGWCSYILQGSSSTSSASDEWFGDYFASWLLDQSVYNLKVIGPARNYESRKRSKLRFIRGVREELRERLQGYVPSWKSK